MKTPLKSKHDQYKTKTLWVRAMNLLACRDHSEKELMEKLKNHYPPEDVQQTIVEMKTRGWILPPRELSWKVYGSLNRKNKSHLFIKYFLKKRGLPLIPKDENLELQKARTVLNRNSPKMGKVKIKQVVSLLKNRGFDTETIRRVLHEVFGNSSDFY